MAPRPAKEGTQQWWEGRRLVEKAKSGYGVEEPGIKMLPKKLEQRVKRVAEHKLLEREKREM